MMSTTTAWTPRQPVTEKVSADFTAKGHHIGVSSVQGWPMTMDDAHCIDVELTDKMTLVGILDGHNGPAVSQLVARTFTRFLKHSQSFKNAHKLKKKAAGEHLQNAMLEAFAFMEAHLLDPAGNPLPPVAGDQPTEEPPAASAAMEVDAVASGPAPNNAAPAAQPVPAAENVAWTVAASAVFVILDQRGSNPRQIVTANVGAARGFLCRKGEPLEVTSLHTADVESEVKRMEDAVQKEGQENPKKAIKINYEGKLFNEISVTRTLGLCKHKAEAEDPSTNVLSGVPDTTITDITPDDSFLVLASDGIWSSMSPTDIVEFVASKVGTDQLVVPCVPKVNEESVKKRPAPVKRESRSKKAKKNKKGKKNKGKGSEPAAAAAAASATASMETPMEVEMPNEEGSKEYVPQGELKTKLSVICEQICHASLSKTFSSDGTEKGLGNGMDIVLKF